MYGESILAVIPRDEMSTAYVLRNNSNLFKVAIPAQVRVGPYLLSGKVLSHDKRLLSLETYMAFAIQGAEISCLLPGAQLTGLETSYVLVIGNHKQLLTPL